MKERETRKRRENKYRYSPFFASYVCLLPPLPVAEAWSPGDLSLRVSKEGQHRISS